MQVRRRLSVSVGGGVVGKVVPKLELERARVGVIVVAAVRSRMTEPTIEDRTFRSRGAANPDVGLIARHATTRDASILALRGVVAGAITQIGDGHAVDEHADGTLSDLARRRCGRGSARDLRGDRAVVGPQAIHGELRVFLVPRPHAVAREVGGFDVNEIRGVINHLHIGVRGQGLRVVGVVERNPRGRPVVTGAGFVVSKTRAYWPELLVSHELSSTSARALRVEGLNTAVRRNLETGNGIITA